MRRGWIAANGGVLRLPLWSTWPRLVSSMHAYSTAGDKPDETKLAASDRTVFKTLKFLHSSAVAAENKEFAKSVEQYAWQRVVNYPTPPEDMSLQEAIVIGTAMRYFAKHWSNAFDGPQDIVPLDPSTLKRIEDRCLEDSVPLGEAGRRDKRSPVSTRTESPPPRRSPLDEIFE